MSWMKTFLAASAVASVLSVGGCRSNPECFFDDECDPRFSCIDGTCARTALQIDAGDRAVTWIEDIEPIVVRRCQQCHSDPPMNSAPFPLVTFANTQDQRGGTPIHQRMSTRALSTSDPMPPVGQAPLTDEEIALIRRWSATGAAEGMPQMVMVDPPDGGVVGRDGGLPAGPLAAAETPTRIQGGFGQLGALLWLDDDDALLFTDVSNTTLHRLDPPNFVGALNTRTEHARGLARDPDGNFIATEYESRQVVRGPDPGILNEVLVADFNGDRLNAPHEVIVRPEDGQVYFTDPSLGLQDGTREVAFNGLYRLDAQGFLSSEWQGTQLAGPYGLAFSPDGSTLYMTESVDGLVLGFDVNAVDGSLGDPVIAVVVGHQPSGLTVDTDGHLYIATAIGVQVFTAGGAFIGRLATPAPATAVVFGGEDDDTLYIAAGDAIYAAKVNAKGR